MRYAFVTKKRNFLVTKSIVSTNSFVLKNICPAIFMSFVYPLYIVYQNNKVIEDQIENLVENSLYKIEKEEDIEKINKNSYKALQRIIHFRRGLDTKTYAIELLKQSEEENLSKNEKNNDESKPIFDTENDIENKTITQEMVLDNELSIIIDEKLSEKISNILKKRNFSF